MATGRVPTTANSPLTAKGDLFGYSTTQARVAVGSDGDTLVADSAATTGLRWSATPSASNPVLNSGMEIWQRGTSFSIAASTAAYTADRWYAVTGVNQAITVSRQTTSDTTNLPNIQYCLRFQRNSGQTGTGNLPLQQSFESVNARPYAGKVVTFSFYARKGADYSAASSLLYVGLYSGTGTDQNFQSGYTGTANIIDTSTTLTATWQRFTFTGTVPTNSTEFAISMVFVPVGTASTNDYYEITGFQIDIGSVALPYRRAGGTIQGELAACQRYYIRYASAQLFGKYGLGYAHSTTQASIFLFNPVTMRVKPTSIEFSLLGLTIENTSTTAITALTIIDGSNNQPVNLNATVASGLTTNRPYELSNNASASGYVGLSAEL
jgi:hypothetical protein